MPFDQQPPITNFLKDWMPWIEYKSLSDAKELTYHPHPHSATATADNLNGGQLCHTDDGNCALLEFSY